MSQQAEELDSESQDLEELLVPTSAADAAAPSTDVKEQLHDLLNDIEQLRTEASSAIKEMSNSTMSSEKQRSSDSFERMLSEVDHMRAEAKMAVLSSAMAQDDDTAPLAHETLSTPTALTEWSEGLLQLQGSFAARMDARGQRSSAAVKMHKYMTKWDAKL